MLFWLNGFFTIGATFDLVIFQDQDCDSLFEDNDDSFENNDFDGRVRFLFYW